MKNTLTRLLPVTAIFTLCVVSAVLMGGCATTTSSGIEASGTPQTEGIAGGPDTSVIINDSGFGSDIEISDLKSAYVGNLLMVQASLRSKKSSTLPIQYKFDWFDARGFEINSNQPWKPMLIFGNESVSIQGVAPDQRAREYKLKLRNQEY
jgi:uncharacterized protein YcfL